MLGVENIDKATLFSWLVVAMTLSGLLLALWIFKRGEKKSKHDTAAYYYNIFCRKLGKAGLMKDPSESANEFLERVIQVYPALKPRAGFITRSYHRIRYGADYSDSQKRQFVNAVKKFNIK